MSQQSIRQEARRAALNVRSRRRRESAEREKRLEDLAVRVLVAVRERDAALVEAELRAGNALRQMTQDEGLSVREAVEWCGDEITTREATRLSRLVEREDDQVGEPKVDDANLAVCAADELASGLTAPSYKRFPPRATQSP